MMFRLYSSVKLFDAVINVSLCAQTSPCVHFYLQRLFIQTSWPQILISWFYISNGFPDKV